MLNVSLSTVASVSLGATSDLSELQAVMLAAALAGLYVAASTHTQQMAEADLIDSEQRYRSLLAAAPDPVVRFEANGDCYAANHQPWPPPPGVHPGHAPPRWP